MNRREQNVSTVGKQCSLFPSDRYVAHLFGLLALLVLTLGCIPQVFAQVNEVEPNNSCPEAQAIGAITLPFTVDGSLDTPPEAPDVDFFGFSATPGTRLIADLEGQATGKGTLPDPFLGLFDSDCNLIDLNDDHGSLNSSLELVVPIDGILVLAASSCCDGQFTGNGGSSGTYQLTISTPPPAIGSIAGRVVDALSGQPLPGNELPYAYVELFRCNGNSCNQYMNSQNTDNEGRFWFAQDFSGRSLSIGIYQIRAFAEYYQVGEIEPFEVFEGQDFDVGDMALEPPLVSFSDIEPCAELLPQGGTCQYSVKLNNNTSARMRGIVWSQIDGWGLGSNIDYTTFEASALKGSQFVIRRRVSVQPLGSKVVRFQFTVPSFVQEGATFCTRAFFGLAPYPLVNTAMEGSLFCITKSTTGFQVMSTSESQRVFKSLSSKSRLLRRIPAPKP